MWQLQRWVNWVQMGLPSNSSLNEGALAMKTLKQVYRLIRPSGWSYVLSLHQYGTAHGRVFTGFGGHSKGLSSLQLQMNHILYLRQAKSIFSSLGMVVFTHKLTLGYKLLCCLQKHGYWLPMTNWFFSLFNAQTGKRYVWVHETLNHESRGRRAPTVLVIFHVQIHDYKFCINDNDSSYFGCQFPFSFHFSLFKYSVKSITRDLELIRARISITVKKKKIL